MIGIKNIMQMVQERNLEGIIMLEPMEWSIQRKKECVTKTFLNLRPPLHLQFSSDRLKIF